MSASERNVLAHAASDDLDHESQIHDIMSASEPEQARLIHGERRIGSWTAGS